MGQAAGQVSQAVIFTGSQPAGSRPFHPSVQRHPGPGGERGDLFLRCTHIRSLSLSHRCGYLGKALQGWGEGLLGKTTGHSPPPLSPVQEDQKCHTTLALTLSPRGRAGGGQRNPIFRFTPEMPVRTSSSTRVSDRDPGHGAMVHGRRELNSGLQTQKLQGWDTGIPRDLLQAPAGPFWRSENQCVGGRVCQLWVPSFNVP